MIPLHLDIRIFIFTNKAFSFFFKFLHQCFFPFKRQIGKGSCSQRILCGFLCLKTGPVSVLMLPCVCVSMRESTCKKSRQATGLPWCCFFAYFQNCEDYESNGSFFLCYNQLFHRVHGCSQSKRVLIGRAIRFPFGWELTVSIYLYRMILFFLALQKVDLISQITLQCVSWLLCSILGKHIVLQFTLVIIRQWVRVRLHAFKVICYFKNVSFIETGIVMRQKYIKATNFSLVCHHGYRGRIN